MVKYEDGEIIKCIFLVDIFVGCCMFWDVLFEGLFFELINQDMIKKIVFWLINVCYCRLGLKVMVIFVDKLMYFGFYQVILFGFFIGINDMEILEEKV